MYVNKVYCYYVEFGNPQELPLIELWKERWKREGWEPHVLGIEDSKRDPRYARSKSYADTLPVLKGQADWSRCNMLRWLAFSKIEGAVTDYDVFPIRRFPPKDFGNFVCADGCGGPGFIIGRPADFDKIVEMMATYKVEPTDVFNGVVAVSEMSIMHRKARPLFDKILHNIECYGRTGWSEKELVHFGNAYLQPYSFKSRVDQVRRILELVYP